MKKALFTISLLAVIFAFYAKYQHFYFGTELLHFPNKTIYAGYQHDFLADVIYGTSTPVSFTEKYICIWFADITTTLSKTDKWYTNDNSEKWSVYNFEVCSGPDCDDSWINFEIGF